MHAERSPLAPRLGSSSQHLRHILDLDDIASTQVRTLQVLIPLGQGSHAMIRTCSLQNAVISRRTFGLWFQFPVDMAATRPLALLPFLIPHPFQGITEL